MAVKRRKNLFGFGKGRGASNYTPASGGIAHHMQKGHGGKASAAGSDALLDEIARGMGGKSYAKLSAKEQATVRKLAGKMSNPKRKRNAELSLPKNKFVNAKVRMKDGKLQVMVDQSLLGHASASGSVSVNPEDKKDSVYAQVGHMGQHFSTVKQARRWIAQMKSRGLHYGRRVQIFHYSGKTGKTKTVLDKEF